MEKLSNAELQAIKERAEKATHGPWIECDGGYVIEVDSEGIVAECGRELDAEFIAHAREDVPKLLSLVAQQQAEIERLQTEVAVLERVVAKPKAVTVHVKKETEFSSWENFPY